MAVIMITRAHAERRGLRLSCCSELPSVPDGSLLALSGMKPVKFYRKRIECKTKYGATDVARSFRSPLTSI